MKHHKIIKADIKIPLIITTDINIPTESGISLCYCNIVIKYKKILSTDQLVFNTSMPK